MQACNHTYKISRLRIPRLLKGQHSCASWPLRNKWCLCTAEDVISDEWRDFVIEATRKFGVEVGKYLRVRPVEGKLMFSKSEGAWID